MIRLTGQCQGVDSARALAALWYGQPHGTYSAIIQAVPQQRQCHSMDNLLRKAVSWHRQPHSMGSAMVRTVPDTMVPTGTAGGDRGPAG